MNAVERSFFKKHFNKNGYVLDFTNSAFDNFTTQIVGFPIQRRYGHSKGKSLDAFFDEAAEGDVVKLGKALLDYEELHIPSGCRSDESIEESRKLRQIIKKAESSKDKMALVMDSIKENGPEYIRMLVSRAKEDLEKDSFDSTLTLSRTILEEAFCHAIETFGGQPDTKGNITDLFGMFKPYCGMKQSSDVDKRINDIVVGLGKIVKSIGDLRNMVGDAHGLGSKRFRVDRHHAKLCLNAACLVAEFVLDVIENRQSIVNAPTKHRATT